MPALLQGRGDREEHGVSETASGQEHGLARGDLGRRPRRTHEHHLLARLEQRAQARGAAHLQNDERDQSARGIGPGAGQGQALHGEPDPVHHLGRPFVVLEPVELPGLEALRGEGRPHDHFDDSIREPDGIDHRGPEPVFQHLGEAHPGVLPVRLLGRLLDRDLALEKTRDLAVSHVRRGHGLHHVSGVDGMSVAEERDEPAFLLVGREEAQAFGGHRLEPESSLGGRDCAVHREGLGRGIQAERAGVLPFVDDVGVRSRRHHHRPGRETRPPAPVSFHFPSALAMRWQTTESTWPRSSRRASTGLMHSANPMPSSSDLITSSWFSR